uniref:Ribosomal protein L16 n=1 Tax=Chroomonas placoidea TaxID=173977 RepID=A0A2P1G8B3_9CRYP|nr:ribosomal protein L16 [Chroomonas placoidea]AVM81126.1 ribosomal protein L16 [Chroomonas placoidea]
MMQPKKTKYKKSFRGKISGQEYKVNKLAFGNLGIKVLKPGRIKASQLEAIRKALFKKLKGKGKIWIRIFPNLSVSAKPVEIRMGKGKGPVSYWCFPVKAGRVIFEIQEKSTSISKEIFKITRNKLALPISLISQ